MLYRKSQPVYWRPPGRNSSDLVSTVLFAGRTERSANKVLQNEAFEDLTVHVAHAPGFEPL
ncbi:MAG: hypothetical protein RIF32_15720, partial [Leptospirales bacterium]